MNADPSSGGTLAENILHFARALRAATALLPDLPAPPNVQRARELVRGA